MSPEDKSDYPAAQSSFTRRAASLRERLIEVCGAACLAQQAAQTAALRRP